MSSPPASPHTPYMTHGQPPVVRVVAGAVIRGGLLLAAQRPPEKSEPGRWELPGGKVEPGESDAEALRRRTRAIRSESLGALKRRLTGEEGAR